MTNLKSKPKREWEKIYKKLKEMIEIEDMIDLIDCEAEILEEIYREENEIHEDYYIWGVWRFAKRLKQKLSPVELERRRNKQRAKLNQTEGK